MPRHPQKKPVRKCHACLLNQGDACWRYDNPRVQWLDQTCPGFENETLYAEFREDQKRPSILTRRALRRDAHRTRKRNLHP